MTRPRPSFVNLLMARLSERSPGERLVVDGDPPEVATVLALIERREAELRARERQARHEAIQRTLRGVAHDLAGRATAMMGHLDLVEVGLPAGPAAARVRRAREAAERAFRPLQVLGVLGADATRSQVPISEGSLRAAFGSAEEPRPGSSPDRPGPAGETPPPDLDALVRLLTTPPLRATPEGDHVVLDVLPPEDTPGAGPRASLRVELRTRWPTADPDSWFEPYRFAPPGWRGLELPMVLSLSRRLGGTARILGWNDRGGTLEVELPLAEQRPEAPPAAPVPTGLRILVADDDVPAELWESWTADLGGTLVHVTDGGAAFDLLHAAPNAFDVLVTDMTMPRMHGAELYRRVRLIRPELPVVVVTGFDQQEVHRLVGVEPVAFGYLHKPFLPRDLSRAIADALAKPRSE